MPGIIAKVAIAALALGVAANAVLAQTMRQRREQRAKEPAAPVVSVDPRDSIVTAAGAFSGRPYWLALARCGGIYFKLNTLYSDAAVRARVVTPNPTANSEFTRKLNEAIQIATTYLDGAEHFLMSERGLERVDTVLIYDGQMWAAGERLRSIDAAVAAAKPCPALYQACRAGHPKMCNESLVSIH